MTKKIIALLSAIALIASLSVSAFAKAPEDKDDDSSSKITAVPDDKKQDMNDLKAEIRDNRLEIKELSKENKQLSADCKALLKQIKQNGTELSEETLGQLEDLREHIADVHSALIVSKGDVREDSKEYKQKNTNGDHDSAIAALEAIIATQEARIDSMEDINSLLEDMLELLEEAAD